MHNMLAELHGLSTHNLIAALLILSALLNSCMQPVSAPVGGPLVGEYAPGSQPYGAEGSATNDQAISVESLSWPQSRGDMVGLLGYPAQMTEWADYYHYGQRWLVIRYSGPDAVGYYYEDK